MQGIQSIGAASIAQGQDSSLSRRPGTAGHPGKHLGQFKRALKAEPDRANMPLIQQQLNALSVEAGNGSGGAARTNKPSSQEGDAAFQIASDHLKSSSEGITDQLAFSSRFNAISTAFF